MRPEGPGRRPTLKDLAEATGTSVSTVSRALSGSPRVGEATRRRIQEEAARTGYRTDLAASLLRAATNRNVGLVCRLEQELHAALHEQILARAQEQRLSLVVHSVSENHPVDMALQALEQLRCQAVIVLDPSQLVGLDLAAVRMPMIGVGQEAPGPAVDLVTSDNTVGMRQACEHLAGLGHRQVCYLDGPAGGSADARRGAFLRAVDTTGLAYRVVTAGASLDAGFQATEHLLGAGGLGLGEDTALVCYNDQCAQGAVVALLRAGLQPGRQVSVTGCDNSRIAASQAFDLTSIDRCPAVVASLAVELACKRLEVVGPPGDAERVRVDTELVVRGSTGPVA